MKAIQAAARGFSLFAASADEQAEAYTAVLPLIAGGQIAPAHDRSISRATVSLSLAESVRQARNQLA